MSSLVGEESRFKYLEAAAATTKNSSLLRGRLNRLGADNSHCQVTRARVIMQEGERVGRKAGRLLVRGQEGRGSAWGRPCYVLEPG